jgi:Holliday junction resolvase RusA-like endonuclease
MTTHTLTIPIAKPPMSSNDQRRAHWTKVRNAKTVVELLVTNAARTARLGKVGPCHVSVTWHAPDARVRDSDALGPFLKASLDALVRCGVIARDDYRHVLSTTMAVRVDRARPRIEIALTEANYTDVSPSPQIGTNGALRGAQAPAITEGES